jgi:hypothetical protein
MADESSGTKKVVTKEITPEDWEKIDQITAY